MTERAYLVTLETRVIVWPTTATTANARAEAETQMHNAAEDEHTGAIRNELPLNWRLDGVQARGTPKRAPEYDRD